MSADICLITEGSYPYYSGGVSQWVDELIKEQKEKTFHILSLVPFHARPKPIYTLPENVVKVTTYEVLFLPKGRASFKESKAFWNSVEEALRGMVSSKTYDQFDLLIDFFSKNRKILGRKILSESTDAWDFILKFYHEIIPDGPFKASFGTFFTIMRSFFSLFALELPDAKLFHAVCTGYAGFILYLAKKSKKVPCFITEHGVYTHERRMEIAIADWIADLRALDLAIEGKRGSLKDFWINAFSSIAYSCYSACDGIFSTFEGTRQVQIKAGADPAKTRTIVHGIAVGSYGEVRKPVVSDTPTVAFIGRVVPIKDVKTYIRACYLGLEKLPTVRFFVLGSIIEDPDYYQECLELVNKLGLKNFHFEGRVDVRQYFPKIDLVVFTSISEVQPLALLEAGSVGIPAISTRVGAAEELIYGSKQEEPHLGAGGIVTDLVSPEKTADAIVQLLTDSALYAACSRAMSARIQKYYRKEEEQAIYREIYQRRDWSSE